MACTGGSFISARVAALLAVGAFGAAGAHADDVQPIRKAPAFKTSDLVAPPRDGWYTNGGSLLNQRYSPLTQINKSNVAKLKAVWRASLGGSGMSPRAGNQAQPIVYDGVVYLMTGDNDAFAISVDTGKVLWGFKSNIDPKVARPCCSWVGRGLGAR